MDSLSQLTRQIRTTEGLVVLEPFQIGLTEAKHELLMFIKPEIFIVDDDSKVENALDLIFSKMDEFGLSISGMAIVTGKVLEQKEIMNRHYGFINRLSRTASDIVTEGEKQAIAEALGLPSLNGYKIMGGHEFQTYKGLTADQVDQIYTTKKTLQLRSGFYFHAYEVDGEKIVLINGFHPSQLLHYTNPDHKVLLMLVHSNTDWGVLRNDMVGSTFPERAPRDSIRGSFYADPAKYGFTKVTIANNGIHLSAGPFEAAFEIVNFVVELNDLDIQVDTPLVIRRLLEKGHSWQEATSILNNPSIQLDGSSTTLFKATEDVNTEEAIALWSSSKQG